MEYITSRAEYRTVKKYDHAKFDEFCSRIYVEGFEAGKESVGEPEIEPIMEEIQRIKGIGPKRGEQIR